MYVPGQTIICLYFTMMLQKYFCKATYFLFSNPVTFAQHIPVWLSSHIPIVFQN